MWSSPYWIQTLCLTKSSTDWVISRGVAHHFVCQQGQRLRSYPTGQHLAKITGRVYNWWGNLLQFWTWHALDLLFNFVDIFNITPFRLFPEAIGITDLRTQQLQVRVHQGSRIRQGGVDPGGGCFIWEYILFQLWGIHFIFTWFINCRLCSCHWSLRFGQLQQIYIFANQSWSKWKELSQTLKFLFTLTS